MPNANNSRDVTLQFATRLVPAQAQGKGEATEGRCAVIELCNSRTVLAAALVGVQLICVGLVHEHDRVEACKEVSVLLRDGADFDLHASEWVQRADALHRCLSAGLALVLRTQEKLGTCANI
jgi:hypothetical protein